ncbi:hypothetical protein ACWD4J_04050 [Streptomyces sp. NPDC002577]
MAETELSAAESDALRFHACLFWEDGRPAVLDERELADTIQVILIDQLEQWADGVLRGMPELRGASPGGPGGVAARLLLTAVPELRLHLSPHRFRPDRAASVIAETAAQARRDLQRLDRAPLVRPAVRHGRLAAHLELLTALSVAARPLLPGWSAFIARQLERESPRRFADEPELPLYFRLP